MTEIQLNLLSERAFNDGYCFSEVAQLAVKEGRIRADDLRKIVSEETSRSTLPKSSEEFTNERRAVLASDLLGACQRKELLSADVETHDENIVGPAKTLALLFEKHALDELAKNGFTERAKALIISAARFCDTAVLHSRHLDEKVSVSVVSEETGIYPTIVLKGMVRIGLLQVSDPSVLTVIEGQLNEINSQNISEFKKKSAAAIHASQVKELVGATPKVDAEPWIVHAFYRVRELRNVQGEPFEKEIKILFASAEFAESLSIGWQTKDLERAKTIAAFGLSAACRAIEVRARHPDTFLRGSVNNRYKDCLI